MNRFSQKAVGAAAFVTALGVTLVALPLVFDEPAFALDAGNPAPPAQGWEHHRPMAADMVEARLAFAKTALKITDAQIKQWNAVADVLRKQAKERDTEMAAMRDKWKNEQGAGAPHHSIIDKMEMAQKMSAKRASNLSELIAAAKPLYAVLSDDQKEVADHLLRGHGGGRFGHRPFGGRGEHGPDGHGPGGPGPAPH